MEVSEWQAFFRWEEAKDKGTPRPDTVPKEMPKASDNEIRYDEPIPDNLFD